MPDPVVLKELTFYEGGPGRFVYAMFPGRCCVFSGIAPHSTAGPNTICGAEYIIAAIAEAEGLNLRNYRRFYDLQTSISYGAGVPNGKFAFQRLSLDLRDRPAFVCHWKTVQCPPHFIAAFAAQIGEPPTQVPNILHIVHDV